MRVRPGEKIVRKSTIISLWPRCGFQSNRPAGYFEMPPCEPCEDHRKAPCRACGVYAKLEVARVAEPVDLGDDKRRIEYIDDLDLAMDLAEPVQHYGILAIEGKEPTEDELTFAYDALEKYLTGTLENEDRIYGATGKHFNIEHAVIACNYFGVDRDWLADTRPKEPCAACGSHNVFNAVRCANTGCGSIMNWEKARELGILTERQEDFGLATGKLKPISALKGAPKAPAEAKA